MAAALVAAMLSQREIYAHGRDGEVLNKLTKVRGLEIHLVMERPIPVLSKRQVS